MEAIGAKNGLLRKVATSPQVRGLKIALTAQEVRRYTMLAGFDVKRNGKPPKMPWTPTWYPPSEKTRFDPAGNLNDLWGHPYVYIPSPSHGAEFAIYSLGPNGVDEKGEGDDIASWRLEQQSKVKQP